VSATKGVSEHAVATGEPFNLELCNQNQNMKITTTKKKEQYN